MCTKEPMTCVYVCVCLCMCMCVCFFVFCLFSLVPYIRYFHSFGRVWSSHVVIYRLVKASFVSNLLPSCWYLIAHESRPYLSRLYILNINAQILQFWTSVGGTIYDAIWRIYFILTVILYPPCNHRTSRNFLRFVVEAIVSLSWFITLKTRMEAQWIDGS